MMPTTLTLKNIPDDLYARLKKSAEAHRRSLNSEVIACLEGVLSATCITTDERLQRLRRLRRLRESIGHEFDSAEIAAAIKQGRE